MAKTEKAEFTTMCMVYDDNGNVLVQDRVDPNWPGIVFPGGHVEYSESFVDAIIREVKEETGLDIENPRICGIKQWQTAEDARYVVVYFKTNKFSGELRSSEEGEVFWLKRSELLDRRCVDGFEDMLAVFESDELSEMYYEKEEGEWVARLK